MQAAINPLLSILGAGAPTAMNGQPSGGPSGFFGLVTSQLATNSDPSTEQNPFAAFYETLAPLLEDLKEVLSALEGVTDIADLPPELTELAELIEGKVSELSSMLSGIEELQSADLSLVPELGEHLPELPTHIGPAILVNAIFQPANALLSDLQGFEGLDLAVSTHTTVSTQATALSGILTSLQNLVRPKMPGQHPVSIMPSLEQLDAPVTLAPQTVQPAPANVQVSPQQLAVLPIQGALRPSVTELPEQAGPTLVTNASELVASISEGSPLNSAEVTLTSPPAISVSPTAGLIEVPKEMVQVIPQEVAGVVQAAQDVSDPVQQVQQSARPEAPQTKFTQAIVGQLRTVDFQEGTTKVELTPRGLGNIELELKTNSDGSLSVVVRAENAHVLSSLRQEQDTLAQIVGQSGEASVDFQEFASDSEQENMGQEAFTGQGMAGEDGGEPAVSSAQAPTIGNGQLDLMT